MYEYVSINEQLIALQNGFHVYLGFVRKWFKIRFVLPNVSAATLCSGRHVACPL